MTIVEAPKDVLDQARTFASATSEPVGASGRTQLLVECIDPAALGGLADAWNDLARRTPEPNVFYEPAFLLPLLATLKPDRRPAFVACWDECCRPRSRLTALVAIRLPQHPVTSLPIVRGLSHAFMPLGTPLYDRDRGPKAIEAILAWIASKHPRLTAIVFHSVAIEGPFWNAVQARAGKARAILLEAHQRAMLGNGQGRSISRKRQRELARQRRRLSDSGALRYATTTAISEIEQAVDRFLVLERSGWKGRRRTALASKHSSFAKSMTRAMAAQGQCRIDALSIDEKPIAMAIVLQTGSRAFFWKIAYDEDFKTLSPGVQLTLELTAHQFADPTVNATDSCATANHPMINRLWPGRITIGDVLLVLPSASPSSLRSKLVVRAEEARRWIRATAKALHSRLTSLMGRTA